MATTLVQATYDVTDTVVTFGKRPSKVPKFACYVRGNRNMADSRTVFKTLTKSESSFFWEMDMRKDIDTNEVEFTRNDCEPSQVSTYPDIIKSLVNKNMIIRTKQNNYLINPNMTLPLFDNYEKVLNKWKSLGGK